jgi:hypothetical protein
MRFFIVTFKVDKFEYTLTIQAYSKYNVKTRLYKMHPTAQIIKIKEDPDET